MTKLFLAATRLCVMAASVFALILSPASVFAAGIGLDNTFGRDGLAHMALDASQGRGYDVAVQSDNKVIIANGGLVYRLTITGTVDATFAEQGFVPGGGTSIALQSDGKLLVASSSGLAVTRYLGNGSLDTTFGDMGTASADFGSQNQTTAVAVSIATDGKIVLGGFSYPITDSGLSAFVFARFTTSGVLDAAFDGDGMQSVSFGSGPATLAGMAVQADGKVVALGSFIQYSPSYQTFIAVSRLTANGALDAAFDGDGKALLSDFAGSNGAAKDVALQSDNKIVIAGYATAPDGYQRMAAMRLGINGALDTTFGASGKTLIPFGTGNEGASTLVIQSDNKIVLGGYVVDDVTGNFVMGVARLQSGGVVDGSFGASGKRMTNIASSTHEINALALDTSNKIVAAGKITRIISGMGYYYDGVALRYTSTGSLDAAFDTDGWTLVYASGVSVRAMTRQNDGKLILAGKFTYADSWGAYTDFAIARFNTDGSPDATFGVNGRKNIYGDGRDSVINAVAVQPADGKIVVVGRTYFYGAMVGRLNADGSEDYTFGGLQTSQHGAGQAVAIQVDGKILAAGADNGDFVIVRYNPLDGSLDTTFDGDGIAYVDVSGGGYDSANSIGLQPDGKIVVAGYADGDMGFARLNTNGSLDTTFNGTGKKVVSFGTGIDSVAQIARQADGKWVGVGSADPSGTGYTDAALVRLNTNGSLDTTFNGIGYKTLDFGSSIDFFLGVAISPKAKITTILERGDLSAYGTIRLAQFNPDGSADTSFGANGQYDIDKLPVGPAALLWQPDGKLVVGGSGIGNAFSAARFTAGYKVFVPITMRQTSAAW